MEKLEDGKGLLGVAGTFDDVVTTTTTTEEEQQQHTSGNSSTGDEASSIEALNWSDFDDDELSAAGVDTALLQSIHSQLYDDGTENKLKLSTSTVSEDMTIRNDSHQEVLETEKIGKDELLLDDDKSLKLGRQGMKRKREESPMMTSTLSALSATSEVTGDLSSNAAVLDDGPIWAKGSKRYKFEENRRVNQKLTFGVLLSVVLAIGLGLGNLVAYNECESEHKAPEVPISVQKSPITPQPPPPSVSPPSIPTEEMIQAISSTPFPMVPPPPPPIQVIPTAEVHIPPPKEVPELVKSPRPMVDPKYALHAEELSKVLKKLDELSRKIDRFENTTRQLGGIVMMKDEIRLREPPSKKSKFLRLLSELMMTKKIKKMENKGGASAAGGREGKTWRDKKEEVLDEIAGVVLEAMQDEDEDLDNIVSEEEEEILLEASQVFPLDEVVVEEVKLPVLPEQSPPQAKAQKTVLENVDHSEIELITELPDEISDDIIISPDRIPTKSKEDGSRKKLKRDFVVDLSDDEFELHTKKGHQLAKEKEEGSRKKKKQSLEEFQKEEKQNRNEFQKEREKQDEEFQKPKMNEGGKFREEKQDQKEFQKQTKRESEAFRKQKKDNQKDFQKQKRDSDGFHKYDPKKERSNEMKPKKVKSEFNPDWSSLRAKNREANRRTGEAKLVKEAKVNNWQAERSKIREQFRGIRT